MTIHIFGIKATAQLNDFSVVAEMIGIIAVGLGLLIYSFVAHLPNATGAHLPDPLVKISMALIFVAIFACGLINMAAVSRLGFSMARDNMLPFSGALSKVSTRYGSPYVMLIVSAVISVLFTIEAKAESIITSVSSVAIFLAYFLVIVAGMRTEKSAPRPHGVFSLGRWALPLGVLALLWCLLICVALTVPSVGHTAGVSSLVVIGIGVVWYFVWVGRFGARGKLAATTSQPDGSGLSG
jgi:amino acid transporter